MAIPFPPPGDASGLPILGQPFTVHTWFHTAMVSCNCSEHQTPMLIVGDSQVTCPKCQKVWVLAGVTYQMGKTPQVVMGQVQTPGTPH